MSTAPDQLTETRTPGATILARAGLCLLSIASGLALRRFGPGLGLSFPLVKYGGSTLWGTMVFFLVAMAAPARSQRRIALMAVSIAVYVELFRLVHTPWLDDFRLTTAGALLLGRVFSPWNMLAYAVGIGVGNVARPSGNVRSRKNETVSAQGAIANRSRESAHELRILPRNGRLGDCASIIGSTGLTRSGCNQSLKNPK